MSSAVLAANLTRTRGRLQVDGNRGSSPDECVRYPVAEMDNLSNRGDRPLETARVVQSGIGQSVFHPGFTAAS